MWVNDKHIESEYMQSNYAGLISQLVDHSALALQRSGFESCSGLSFALAE